MKDEGQRECGAAEPPTRTRFVPPTVEEVATYVRERGSAVDPQVFLGLLRRQGLDGGQEQNEGLAGRLQKRRELGAVGQEARRQRPGSSEERGGLRGRTFFTK